MILWVGEDMRKKSSGWPVTWLKEEEGGASAANVIFGMAALKGL